MDKKRIEQIKLQFDNAIQTTENEQIEYWYARDLMKLLGYSRWENFENAIRRAIDSCETAQIEVSDHFREITKLITAGKGAKRPVSDYMLTRYACYLIAMNGDTTKDEIAFADFLPTLTIAAKNLATEMTNYNVENKDLYGESSITGEHVQNNTEIRKMLKERGIKPEELPPAEDIKKLERRTKSQDKKVIEKSGRFSSEERNHNK